MTTPESEPFPDIAAEQASSGRASYREGVGFNALSFAGIALLGLVTSVITARIYGISIIGKFALVVAPADALWLLSSVKEQAALVRELTSLPRRAPRITGLFTAVVAFSTGLTAVTATIVAIGTYFVYRGPIGHPELFAPALVSLGCITVIMNLGWNLDAVLSAFMAGRELFWIRMHQAAMFFVLSVPIGLATKSIWGLVIATYGGGLTSLIHRVVTIRRFMRLRVPRTVVSEGFRTLPSLLRFGVKVAPGTVLQGITMQSATWMIGITGSVTGLGAFSRAQMLTKRFDVLHQRIAEMMFPALVARHEQGDGHGFDRALVDTVRYAAIFLVLMGSVGAGASAGIMSLFGAGFGQGADALAVLLALPALTTISVLQAHALYAVGRPGVTSITAAFRMVLTIGASIALTPAFGLVGAALALVAGGVVDVIWRALLLRPYLSGPVHALWSHGEVAALLFAAAGGWTAARATVGPLPMPTALPVSIIAGVVAFAVAFLALGGMNSRDRQRLSQVAARLPPRILRLAAALR